MIGRGGWKTASGILAAWAMLFGCFAPVIYGAYKIYDKGTHQVIVLNVMEKPETVYKVSIATAEEREFKIATRDDKEMLFTGKTRRGLEATAKISGLREGGSKLTLTVEKGKDPKGEHEEMVTSVLSVCSKLGTRCTEETGK